MLSNYFTLVRIARLIHRQCAGHRIFELYSQQKQQLCIGVESDPIQTIVVSCEPSENFVYIRDGNFRARKNSVDLFPEAMGKKIESVACDAHDRVVNISLDGRLSLECEMFGSRANVILWKEEHDALSDVAVDAFLKKKELLESRRVRKEVESLPQYDRMIQNQSLFLDALRAGGEERIFQSLKKAIPVIGSTLAKEILYRAGIDPLTPVLRMTERQLTTVVTETSNVIAEVKPSVSDDFAGIYSEAGSPVCMSLLPLRMYERATYTPFSNTAAAIQKFVGTMRAASTFNNDKEHVSGWLEKEEKKASHTYTKMQAELEEHDRSADYELFGKLIMAHLPELRKGMRTALLEDTVSSGSHRQTASVPLDPALSPVHNAEKYFEKSKKARVAVEETTERVKSLDRRLSALRMLIGELAEVHTNEMLKQFHQSYKILLQETGYMTTKEKENLPPFRIFAVDGGFQVLAGKSSENNDMLTMKYAKPNDLWFHSRGSSGSHVVLKVNSAQGEPSKRAIHQAASIAAYYSKMKNASSVPVAMTEKKFVRKPKGAPAGTVVLEREKVIFVEPKLPPSSIQA